MGAHPYQYRVAYRIDAQHALDELRVRELEAGRYNPVMSFPASEPSAIPGREHATIEEAVRAASSAGTRSILDVATIVSRWPAPRGCCASAPEALLIATFETSVPLCSDVVEILFGARPHDRAKRNRRGQFWDSIGRGSAVAVVAYENELPHEVFFFGYSHD